MPNEKQQQKEQIKVTDKRIFTSDGEIREEFREQIKPAEPPTSKPAQDTPRRPAEAATPAAPSPRPAETERRAPGAGDRRRLADNPDPGTPFAGFIQSLAMQAYMSLGMLPNPYQPQAKPEPGAARQLIDILSMLQEKTKGNLTQEEEDFLTTLLGELKLNYVKLTKNLA